jgi:hypothetical protein
VSVGKDVEFWSGTSLVIAGGEIAGEGKLIEGKT